MVDRLSYVTTGWLLVATLAWLVLRVARRKLPSVGVKFFGVSLVIAGLTAMFRREAESLGRLNHPGIAAIHDAGRTDDGLHWCGVAAALRTCR